MSEYFDALKSMYEEHVAQARHHEVERERMTALIVAVAAALVGVISHESLAPRTLLLSLLLIPLGVFGKRFSAKHYERNRFHTTIASHFRDAMDSYLTNQQMPIPARALGTIRDQGESAHNNGFSLGGKRSIAKSSIANWRLYQFWNRLHVTVAILGAVLVVSTLAFWLL